MPYLPEAIDVFLPGEFVATTRGSERKIRLPTPFDNGYLAAKFRVMRKEYKDGVQLPMDSLLECYRHRSGGTDAKDILKFAEYHIVTSTLLMGEQPLLQPTYTERTLVIDDRFKADLKGRSVSYLVTNKLYSKETVMGLVEFKKLSDYVKGSSYPWLKVCISIGMVLLLLGPFGAVIYFRRRIKTENQG